MDNFEYKTVGVPARMGAQSRELNKWAKRGWEVVEIRHIWATGRARAYLRRTVAAPAPNQVAAVIDRAADSMDGFSNRMTAWTAKQRVINAQNTAARKAAKAARKTGTQA